MQGLFRQNKAFRLLLAYRFFSGLGGGIFSFFMLLSVHLLYQNPIYTGIAGFLITSPFIFSFAVGPIVDRGNKVAIMRITTVLEFVVLGALVFIPFQENFGVVFMFAVIFIYSIAALFEVPASKALLPQIVDGEKIVEANSLMQIVTLVGGIAIAVVLFVMLEDGADFIFLYGLSAAFLAIAFLFSLALKKPQVGTDVAKTSYIDDLKAGGKFICSNVLFYITIAMVVKAFVVQVASVNMPAFAEYHVGARGYVVIGVVGMAGGLLASSLVGMFGKSFKIGQLLLVLFALAGGARIGFVHFLPENYHRGLGMLLLFAALNTATGIVFQSLGQKIPPKDMVARVDTLSTSVVAIFVSLGALAGGFMGSIVSDIRDIFVYQGISFIIIGVLIFLVPAVRKLGKVNDIKND